MNRLWYGDNLTIMKQMRKHSVDLVYLDPPFNSDQTYNLLYRNMTGKPVPEQAEAFFDTWELDALKEEVARRLPILMIEYGVDDEYAKFWAIWISALRQTQPRLLAYLIYMTERLLEMKSLLRPTGSIYLHCDPTASHYIKVLMDGIFGHANFRSEIIWKRTSAHNSAKRWGPVHDVILFYSASSTYTWNKVFQPYDQSYIDEFYRHVDGKGRYRIGDLTGAGVRQGASGSEWRGINPTDKGRHWAPPRKFPGGENLPKDVQSALDELERIGRIYWPAKEGGVPGFKRYLEDMEGVQIQDIIDDIAPVSANGKERLGYPTQKPVSLLKRIISASTSPDDVVFDPFCGCGTTIYAAQELGRQWIGCDIAILSVKLVREVLIERYRLVEGAHYDVDGIPASVEQARMLFDRDHFQFQHWFVERIGGFPMQKKVADRGIDGRLYFETGNIMKEMVLSVKGGKLKPADVRDLRGVLEREQYAELAAMLTLEEPSKAMRQEANDAGLFEYKGVQYPRIQFLSVKELLEEKKHLNTPTRVESRLATGQASLPL